MLLLVVNITFYPNFQELPQNSAEQQVLLGIDIKKYLSGGRFSHYLSRSVVVDYNANAGLNRATAKVFEYDSYGNPKVVTDYGEVNLNAQDGTFADIGNDLLKQIASFGGRKGARLYREIYPEYLSLYKRIRKLNQKSTSPGISKKELGELLGHPNEKDEGNQQPSRQNVLKLVRRKVQRPTGEDAQTNNPDTSAQSES